MPDFNFRDLMKMQGAMKDLAEEVQKKQEELRVSAASGGDMVTVIADGHPRVRQVQISDEAFGLGKEALETLVMAAVNAAIDKAMAEVQALGQKSQGELLGKLFSK